MDRNMGKEPRKQLSLMTSSWEGSNINIILLHTQLMSVNSRERIHLKILILISRGFRGALYEANATLIRDRNYKRATNH